MAFSRRMMVVVIFCGGFFQGAGAGELDPLDTATKTFQRSAGDKESIALLVQLISKHPNSNWDDWFLLMQDQKNVGLPKALEELKFEVASSRFRELREGAFKSTAYTQVLKVDEREIRHGKCTFYNAFGERESEGCYVFGQREGRWFYRTASTFQVIEYHRGVVKKKELWDVWPEIFNEIHALNGNVVKNLYDEIKETNGQESKSRKLAICAACSPIDKELAEKANHQLSDLIGDEEGRRLVELASFQLPFPIPESQVWIKSIDWAELTQCRLAAQIVEDNPPRSVGNTAVTPVPAQPSVTPEEKEPEQEK